MKEEIQKTHWFKLILSGLGGPIILYLGIVHLLAAYNLGHPQAFIMYFFSASFMILLGLTILAYLACHVWILFAKRSSLSLFKD